jgi:glutamine synthetase
MSAGVSKRAASPAAAQVEQAIETFAARGVHTARVSHCDLFGKCRSKDLPLDRLAMAVKGLGFCLISMVEDINGNPLDLPGFAGDSPFPDMHSRVDLSTGAVLPWEPDTAWFLADLHGDHGLSPRGALRRAAAELEVLGLNATMAPELEFYLLERQGEAVARYGAGTGLAYTTGRHADPRGAFKRIHRGLVELGLGVTAAHHEFSPGQFEINLDHGEALDAADRAFRFKEAVRELAACEGLEANFMAKPFTDAEGSSCHVHVSLGRDGENVFAGDDNGLADTCRAFVAGLLEHADGLTALGAPTVNSYRRLVPGGMAPTRADWGGDHRFTYIRIPPERLAGTRVELRGADSSANPYLLQCGVLVAGLDGIRRGLRPPQPCAAGDDSSGRLLPQSLERALDALESDPVLVDGLGSELVRTFAALKRNEAQREHCHVSGWDWAEYAFHS